MAYCRLARAAGDDAALAEALPLTRRAMRERLVYELAHTRGGVILQVPMAGQCWLAGVALHRT